MSLLLSVVNTLPGSPLLYVRLMIPILLLLSEQLNSRTLKLGDLAHPQMLYPVRLVEEHALTLTRNLPTVILPFSLLAYYLVDVSLSARTSPPWRSSDSSSPTYIASLPVRLVS